MTKQFRVIWDNMMGDAVPDGKVVAYVDQKLRSSRGEAIIGTASLLNEFRLRKQRNEIGILLVQYGEEVIEATEGGRLPHWPYGLDTLITDQLAALARW